MRIAKEGIDTKLAIPGATIRQQADFGDASGYGKISAEYFTLVVGVDTTDAAGQQETVTAHDLFLLAAGTQCESRPRR